MVEKARCIVVKVGSSVIATPGRGVNRNVVESMVHDISHLVGSGKEVILVSSGAIACGMEYLGMKVRPVDIATKQAIAAVGQPLLMSIYREAFSKHGITVSQILLSREDIMGSRRRFINTRNTFSALRALKVLPIVNENDSVVVEEIKFGDNDTLSSYVAGLVGADLLVILSDIDGIYMDDPKKEKNALPIDEVRMDDGLFRRICGSSRSAFGTGGVASKIKAAERAAKFGIPTIVANGRVPGILRRIMDGERVGTFIYPGKRLRGRKVWIGFYSKPKGKIYVDDGAKRALIERGGSLLPSGIVRVEGDFKRGDVVMVVDLKGREFARGLTNYSSDEVKLIMGRSSKELPSILGYTYRDEVIHRDDMYFEAGDLIPTSS